jgi:SAM-dependent methyltransferase
MRGLQGKGEPRDFYEGRYVDDFEKQPVERLARLVPLFDLNREDDIVDFACGNGMLAGLISGRIKRYTGVDFSRAFITAAERRAELLGITNARFVCDDIGRFCAKHRGVFSKAFTMDFSEHISDAAFISVYSAILGSLKQGGTLYIHTPNGDYFIEVLKRIGVLRQFPEHIGVRNARCYRELLRKSGFQDVEIRRIAHYNVMKYLHFLSYLPVVGRFGAARLFIECVK